jgi:hypothetical protein
MVYLASWSLETHMHVSIASVLTTDCRLCNSNNILPSIGHISDCPSKDLFPPPPTNLSPGGQSKKKRPPVSDYIMRVSQPIQYSASDTGMEIEKLEFRFPPKTKLFFFTILS